MYYLLSLLTGVLISVMVAVNGGLTELYGVYPATVIIHIAGLLLISALILGNREHPFLSRQGWVLYLGGAIGVMTTVFNNLAYGRISVSAIMALGLFGQSIAGLIIDQYGLMGMSTRPFQKRKICGLFLIFGGITAMINNFDMIPVLVSFIAGVLIIISRTLNARLAEATSMRVSTFYNYLIGLAVSIPVCFISGGNGLSFASLPVSPKLYIYLGGIIGVCVVLLSNMTVTKLSAFYLSLLLFLGQVFAGILIDIVVSRDFSPRSLAGGVLVAVGLCVNLLIDRRQAEST